jgi:hypothetical protein
MSMDAFAALSWSLLAGALLLAVAAIPLAYRRAGPHVWAVHAGLALAVGLMMAVAAHVAVFGSILPWWRTGGAYLAEFSGPALATAWVARASDRRWPTRSRWRVAAAALAALVVAAAGGAWLTTATLPMLVNAVQ